MTIQESMRGFFPFDFAQGQNDKPEQRFRVGMTSKGQQQIPNRIDKLESRTKTTTEILTCGSE